MRLLSVLALTTCLFTAGASYAAVEQHPAEKAKPAAKQKAVQINMYAEPTLRAKIVQSITPAERLVPIFRKGEWIKVGDPKDGSVGWINHDQYRKAMEAFYQPNFQTVFIRTQRDKNGKPVTSIVAYKNGKKLSEKDADALYKKIRQEQANDAQNMQRLFWDMDNMMEQQEREMHQFVEPWDGVGLGFGPGPEIVQPVIIMNSVGHDEGKGKK